MNRFARLLACGSALVLASAISGCADRTPNSSAPPAVTSNAPIDEHDHSGGPPLSDEDKALASLQKLCPVSEEELGAHDMQSPVKLIVKGETVFVCCKGCEKKVREDEDAILVKVAELKKASSVDGDTEKN